MKTLLVWLALSALLVGCSPRKFHHYDARTGTHTFTKISAYDRDFMYSTQGELRFTPDSITFVMEKVEIPFTNKNFQADRAKIDSISNAWSESERYREFGRFVTERRHSLQELGGIYPTWLIPEDAYVFRTFWSVPGNGEPHRFLVHRGPRIPILNDYDALRLRFRNDRESFSVYHNRTSVLQRIRKVFREHWHEATKGVESL